MKRKYLFNEIMIKCPSCSDGRFYPDVSCDQQNCDFSEPCPRCNGMKYIKITSEYPDFIKYYKTYLEGQERLSLKELRTARENESRCTKNYSEIVKELDKVINIWEK
jgi:acetyl-CoA carboxylase beta subunit